MSDLTALESWREGRIVSRADIDMTIAGVAARIAELERLWLYPERWVVGRPNQEPVEEIHLTIEQHEALVARIDELEAGILAVATELLPRIENGLDLGEGYTMLRHLAEAIPRQALGDNDE